MTAVPSEEIRRSLAAQRRYDRQAALFDFWEAPMEMLAFGRLRRRLWSQVAGARILEIGVGTGKNLPYHPAAARTVAVDISPRMLRRAAARALRLGREVDLVLADAERLPGPLNREPWRGTRLGDFPFFGAWGP